MSVQMIDVPKAAPGRSWLDNKPTLTQAHPKQTLFGTSLQRRDKNLVEDLRSMNLKAYEEEKSQPQNVRGRLSPAVGLQVICEPDAELLSRNRSQFEEHKKQTTKADNFLSSIEEKSRYFKVQSKGDIRQPTRERSKQSQKMTEKDLEHTSEVNSVGLKNGSYNHHKYGNKPPVHQYCLIGDPLSKGMDFTEVADKPNHMVPKMQPFKRHRDPYAVPKEVFMTEGTGAKVTVEDMAIPANIQHQFGTQVCQMLLADPEKVKRTIEDQKRARQVAHRPHQALDTVKMPEENLDPSYQEIGTSTRSNIFGPSVTFNHKIGLMKQNFNDDVHKRRVPETDEYKYQRDELSLWWQYETLRGRMMKKWEEYEANRPKFTVNWDRNATRPPPPPKPKEPKPKPKPKPKPEKKAPSPLNDIVFEDIEFKTPPLTPKPTLPPPPAPAKISQEDDDFWDFYDQGPPLP